MKREFTVVIEKDEDAYFIGTVPQIRGCHTQAKSLDELMARMSSEWIQNNQLLYATIDKGVEDETCW